MAESSLPFVSCSFVFSSRYSVARRWLPCLARILTLMTRDDRCVLHPLGIVGSARSRTPYTLHTLFHRLWNRTMELVKNSTFICYIASWHNVHFTLTFSLFFSLFTILYKVSWKTLIIYHFSPIFPWKEIDKKNFFAILSRRIYWYRYPEDRKKQYIHFFRISNGML